MVYVRFMFLILLLNITACTSIHQSKDVAIVLDSQKGEYVSAIQLPENIISPDLFQITHEMAILSENIYQDNIPAAKDMAEGCSVTDKTLPDPEGWEFIESHHPEKPDKWYLFGMSGGIKIETWKKKISESEMIVAIVFRGTDFKELGDWYSNFRWVTRLNPFIYDQYDQARDIIPAIVEKIINEYGEVRIVTTGHSLGGGLAQQAGYSSDKINEIYAFSPSSVTGYFSVASEKRKINSDGITIYRIYEKGEILGYLRGFMRNISPLTSENPKIIEVGYNFSHGNPIKEHSMRKLACGLYATYKEQNTQ